MNYLHDRSRTVIAEALAEAAARGHIGKTTLVDFVDESYPFNRHDLRARRIWHDELYRQIDGVR